MVDPQKYPQEFHHEGHAGPIPSLVPPGFSPEDAVYMQHGPYPEKHFHTPSTHHRYIPVYDAMEDPEGAPGYPPMGGGRQFPDQHRDLPVVGGIDPHKLQVPPPAYYHHLGPPPQLYRQGGHPSTLSLDAEPFYPSSKGHQGGHPRMVDPQKHAQEFHHEGHAGPMPNRVPPGFSPEDAVYMQHGLYPEKHFNKPDYPGIPGPTVPPGGPRSRPLPPPPPPHHGKSTPPSPPPYSGGGGGGDGQHFPYNMEQHHGMEPVQEHVPGFRAPSTHHGDMPMYDAMEDPGGVPGYPPMGGGRQFPDQHRDLPVVGGID
ncbi:MAG: hypothetical protein MJE68_18900, partial [Proteobacteria bacterium]|nr:hypothetical protein [Pseudomonadota bacterium]